MHTTMRIPKRVSLCLLFLIAGFTSLNAQDSVLAGKWEGAISVQGQQLIIIFEISGQSGSYSGTLDIPQQGARELPLNLVEHKGDSVTIAFSAGPTTGRFEGTMPNDSLISGTYYQGAGSFPFKVERKEQITEEPEKEKKEKEEEETGKELTIRNGDITIGGTLVLPDQPAGAPLVIMISGSGAQNRDSNIFGFRVFAKMAEYLKSQGIASFRYDDRQVGQSTGSFADASLGTLASDVDTIMNHLADSIDYQFGDIVLLGHSQGGVVAGKVAAENDMVDKLILMASPGIPLKEVLRFQVRQAYGENIHPAEEVEKETAARERLMEALRADSAVEEAKQAYIRHYRGMLDNLPEQQKQRIGDLDVFARRQADQLVAAFDSPQMQSLLFHDPATDFRKIDKPVLVLFGGKDTQVTEGLNKEPIRNALEQSGAPYQIMTFPDANHLFQRAETGSVAEYATLEKEFTDGFLQKISDWIKSR